MSFLSGKRTLIVAIIAFVMGGLHALGYVDQDLLVKADLILAPLGLAFLRLGAGKK